MDAAKRGLMELLEEDPSPLNLEKCGELMEKVSRAEREVAQIKKERNEAVAAFRAMHGVWRDG